MRAFPRNPLRRAWGWPALRVQGILENLVKQIGRPDLLDSAHVGLFDRDFHQSFVRTLDQVTLSVAKDIWVEKTPAHLHHIDQIQSRISRTKFIHIIRNGADVVASLYKVTNEHPHEWALISKRFFRGYSVEQCVAIWNHDILLSAKWIKEPNHILVKYEELVDNPPAVLQSICQFLEIDYANDMERPEQVSHKIVNPREVWKANNTKGICKPRSTFDAIFNEHEKRFILDNLVHPDSIDWEKAQTG
jgi:hypothetical protein